MQQDDSITLLKKHIQRLSNYDNDFDTWLSTAIELSDKIFGMHKQHSSSVRAIQGDYRIHKIYNSNQPKTFGLDLKKGFGDFEKRSKQLLEGFIEQLEFEKYEAIKQHQQVVALNQQREKEIAEQKIRQESSIQLVNDRLEAEEKTQETIDKNKPKPKRKCFIFKFNNETKNYNISQWSIGLFISASLALITLSYNIGLNQGKTKFDQEKINLQQENTSLKTDTSNLHKQIRLDSIILNSSKPKL